MLEADAAMKHTQGPLLNPSTAFGKRYRDAKSAGASGNVCFASRVWIVPGDVQVREDGDSLYVLKAPLDVKTESELGRPVDAECPQADPAADERREQVEREMVLPEIVKAVNTAPEYAPLRRAFMARVIAQWIRKRHDAGRTTSYDDIIGSGNLGPAELRDGWKPRQTWDAYVKAYNSREFTDNLTGREGNAIVTRQFVFGGVDWSKLQYDGISGDEMSAKYGGVPDAVNASAKNATTAADGTIWLGAATPVAERSAWQRATGRIGGLKDGPAGVVAIIAVALLALMSGFRGPRRRDATGTPPEPPPTG